MITIKFISKLSIDQCRDKLKKKRRRSINTRLKSSDNFKISAFKIPMSMFKPTFYGQLSRKEDQTVIKGEFRTPVWVQISLIILVFVMLAIQILPFFSEKYNIIDSLFFLGIIFFLILSYFDSKKRAVEEKREIIDFIEKNLKAKQQEG